MSPNRGPLGTIVAVAATLLLLFGIFGCGSEDATAPETGFGTIEITMPADTEGATWHLYGPGDSFRHGDTDLVLENLPAGQYTIIWTAVKDWTGPAAFSSLSCREAVLELPTLQLWPLITTETSQW